MNLIRSIRVVMPLLMVLLVVGCGGSAPPIADLPPTAAPATTAVLASADRVATQVAATLEAIAVAQTLTAIAQAAQPTAPVTDVPAATAVLAVTSMPLAATEPPTNTTESVAPTNKPLPSAVTSIPKPPTNTPVPPSNTPAPPTNTPAPPPEEPVALRDISFGGSPLPDDGSNVVAGGIKMSGVTGKQGDFSIISKPFAIMVDARIPKDAAKNGDGVATVTFLILKDGVKEHERTEKSANYCAFGDVGPVCKQQQLDDDWPDGEYSVNVTIKPNDSSTPDDINWNFTFIIKRA